MAYIDDGFPTIITLTSPASVKLKEVSITPGGVLGGGGIDNTTMRNTAWRTNAPKSLVSLGPTTLTATYDPDLYTQIISAVQVNQLIVVTFPDTSELQFWGFIDELVPGELTEGGLPTVQLTIIPSNKNASSVETAPVLSQS